MSNRQSRRGRPPPDLDPSLDPGPGSGSGSGRRLGPGHPKTDDEEDGDDVDDNRVDSRAVAVGLHPAALTTTWSGPVPTYTTRAVLPRSGSFYSQQPPQLHLEHQQQRLGGVDEGDDRRQRGHAGAHTPGHYEDLGLELKPQQAQALQAPASSDQELSAAAVAAAAAVPQRPRQRQLGRQHQLQQLQQLQHQRLIQQQQQHQRLVRQQQHHQHHQHHQQEHHQHLQPAGSLASPALDPKGQERLEDPQGPQQPQQLHSHDSHRLVEYEQQQQSDQHQHGRRHLEAQAQTLTSEAFLPEYHQSIGPPQPQHHHSHHPHRHHPHQQPPLPQPPLHHSQQPQPGPHPRQPVYFVPHPPLVDPTAAAAAAAAATAPGLVSSPPSSSGSTLCHPHDPRLLHASELQTTIAWFPTSDEPSAVPQLHNYTAPSDFYDPNHDPHTTDDPTFYHHRPYHHPHHQQRPLNWPFIQLPDGQTVLSMHPELSILNAESYHDGSASSFRAPRSLPPRPTPTPSTPGADEGRTRSHRVSRHGTKRSMAQAVDALDDADMPDKKKRGRPKLDTDDQTAQDRRRTQIRLAQRAYRNRKETAIQTLEKQVEELKQNNEQMSNAFMRLYDYAVADGLLESLPEFGRQLRATTETFLAIARSSSEDKQPPAGPGHDSEEGNTGSPGSGSEKRRNISGSPDVAAAHEHTSSAGQPILMAGLIVHHEPEASFDEPAESDVSVWRHNTLKAASSSSAPAYEIVTQPTVHNASFPFGTSSSPPAETLAASTTLLLPTPKPGLSGHLTLAPGGVPALSSPPSLSYQERTFGRRLQRRAVEQAVRLLSMPEPPPEAVAGVFGFCLLFESRERIVERLANCLSVNRRETLSNWRHPFLHLGGAGTFFQDLNELDSVSLETDMKEKGANLEHGRPGPTRPRPPVGNEGTDEPNRSKIARDSNFGPGPWSPAVEETKDLRVDHRLRISSSGFEGDFFDCDEVEWYLQQRGIVIPPAADFVSADIDDSTLGAPTQAPPDSTAVDKSTTWLSGDAGTAGSSLAPTPATSSDTWSGPTVTGEEEIAALLAAPLPTHLVGGTVPVDPTLYDLSQRGSTKTATPPKRRVSINVEILVEQLVQRSVCLGRAPGIRPKDVNVAFWQSVV
ncbi:hypothetical protein VD0002_g8034 [Verticillium dahliae]|uniref:BZIP domain-containing protein n=2 Tax=Verticillium dahliae TaxID=27337 RepID=A0AA45AIJ8_VERDA|nr:C2 domain-containing protein C31G5.15 [Verticillium dahliae VDG2]PNH28701.1 hypothetical protein BJF96_g8028 [Verticillium dahliae]PNH49953.1 hypothetical protein VD0003_g7197 [Verticillium dahliae]PNH59514.1 hypothetical protein VD0002_g8034 [Verticillium dahliae]